MILVRFGKNHHHQLSSVARWCMGNATHAPPNTSWEKTIPNVEFWFDLVKIITTKPRTSVARWCLGNGTLSPPSHWAQWRSWRIFPKIEQLRRGVDGFFKKSSSSVGNSRSWRIFPKIEQLSRDGADGFFQKSSGSSKMLKVSLFPLI